MYLRIDGSIVTNRLGTTLLYFSLLQSFFFYYKLCITAMKSLVSLLLGENGEESCLFSVKKKLDQTGHVEISSEVDMDLYDLISLNKVWE